VCVREEGRETRHSDVVRVEVERSVLIPDICFGRKLVRYQHFDLFMLGLFRFTMLMMTIFGLIGDVEEQSGDASLFANALLLTGLVSTERCTGFECERAKDEANALAANRPARPRMVSFMLAINEVYCCGEIAL
jgi:hypothetical protein